MSELSNDTLVIAIQAVDAEIHQIAEQLDNLPPGGNPALDDLLLVYQTAARELKSAYEQAQSLAIDLPPYEELVRVVGFDEEARRTERLH